MNVTREIKHVRGFLLDFASHATQANFEDIAAELARLTTDLAAVTNERDQLRELTDPNRAFVPQEEYDKLLRENLMLDRELGLAQKDLEEIRPIAADADKERMDWYWKGKDSTY